MMNINEIYTKLERMGHPISLNALSQVLNLLDYRKTVAERIKWDERIGVELIEKINEDIRKLLCL